MGLSLLVSSLAHASVPGVLVRFFGHQGIADQRAVYQGEMLKYYLDKPTFGQNLPRDVRAQFRELVKRKNRAVYAVLLSDGHTTGDWYAFLVRESGGWKLSAVRDLALPPLFYMVLRHLRQTGQRTPSEEWQYRNMLLTTKSDNELKAYLRKNLVAFRNVITLFSKGKKASAELAAKHLLIGSLDRDGKRYMLTIGGILDNSVGFMYVAPGGRAPDMSPDNFIYVEEVVGGWYLYKTT